MTMPEPFGPGPFGPRPRLVAAAAMLGLVAAATPAVAGAAAHKDRPEAVLADASAPARVKGELPSTAVRSRFVSLADDGLTGRGVGAAVSFEVFPGETFAGRVEGTSRDGESTSWTGTFDGGGGSWVASRVDDTFFMSLETEAGMFEVSSVGGDTYRVAEVELPELEGDDAVRPPEGKKADVALPDAPAAREPASAAAEAPTAADAGNVVDILVVATQAARTEEGSDAALAAHVSAAIAQMNEAIQRSGVPAQVRLAGVAMTSTTEVGGDLQTDLRRVMTPGDGYFDEAQAHRDALHADLVSLWVGGTVTTACGRGYLATDEVYGYNILFGKTCSTANKTFAHEAGHNFRLEHDASASEVPSTTTKPYARGFTHINPAANSGWYTIMAYPTACRAVVASCIRISNYSNPHILEGGVATGTAAANNAQAMAEHFATVANYRQERIYPGTPTITGDPRFGQMLSVHPGAWLPTNTSLGFQWFADGVPMAGATGTTLTVTKWMIGRSISVQVTGSAPHYAPAAAGIAGTAPVAKAVFGKRGVFLAGKPRVGRVLTVKTRIRPGTKKLGYKWFRGSKRIKGVKGRSYRLTRADRGKKVYVKVTARKKGYETLVKKSRRKRVR